MPSQLRRAILASVALFVLTNPNYQPKLEEAAPQAKEVPHRDSIVERRIWLQQEAWAYAFHQLTQTPLAQAREVTALLRGELLGGIDEQALVLGVIAVESQGNPQAVSPAGARGLMQIMPHTGRFIAQNLEEEWSGSQSLFEMDRNVRYGVWYLGYLQESFPEQRATLEAYNWGPDRIQRRLQEKKGLPQAYSRKVLGAQAQLKEEMYDFYRTHYWRSLNLAEDPPYFGEHPSEP